MKIAKINAQACQLIRQAVDVVIKAEMAKLGLDAKSGRMTYSDGSCTLKVEIVTRNADGSANSKQAEDFKAYASMYGLEPEDLGKEFTHRGVVYKIVGLKTRGRKFPIQVERVHDGKTFKFPDHTVAKELGHESAEPIIVDNLIEYGGEKK